MRLASVIGVKALPPADISDIIHSTEKSDWTKLGILDMFLGCIAKALTVQLKAKGTTIVGTAGMAAGKGVTTVTLPMIFNSRYSTVKLIDKYMGQRWKGFSSLKKVVYSLKQIPCTSECPVCLFIFSEQK